MNISLNAWGKRGFLFLASPIGYLQSFAPPAKFLATPLVRNVAIQLFEHLLVTEIWNWELGIALRNDEILTLRYLWFRRFKGPDVTVILSFQTCIETIIHAGPESAFDSPFILNSLFASLLSGTGWVGALKLTLSPDAGNPRYATGIRDSPGCRFSCEKTLVAQNYLINV